MKLSDALVEALIEMGVAHVFGVSGANIEHLHDAIHRLGGNRIRSVMAKHEASAAFMADGYARVHRRLGVCCATSGGGMLNLVAGIAESYADSVPVLAIIGQPPMCLEGNGAFQDSSGENRTVNGTKLWESVSKYAKKITRPEMFWTTLATAIVQSMSGRAGPSVLLIPRNLYDQDVGDFPNEWRSIVHMSPGPQRPCEGQVQRFYQQLKAAKKPIFIFGRGLRQCSDQQAVLEFALESGIPVATTMSARGDFPNDADNYLGVIGVAGHPSVHRYILEEADFIVAVGTGLPVMSRQPIEEKLQQKKLMFVNIEKRSISSSLRQNEVIEADAGKFFLELLQLSKRAPMHKGNLNYERSFVTPKLAPMPYRRNSRADHCLTQSDAILLLDEFLPEQSHLVFDAGNCAAASMHYTQVPKGASSTIALGMGGMGYAFGAAIGAQIGSKNGARTFAFVGDGAFLMSGSEIHTAAEHELPILYVVFNNNQHGMCITRQQLFFDGRVECSMYGEVHIAQMCRGFADPDSLWIGYAETLKDLKQKLENYFAARPMPGVLEIRLRQEEMPPFTPFFSETIEETSKQVLHRQLWAKLRSQCEEGRKIEQERWGSDY